jgi:Na+/H+-dicarboxylate symporter
LQKNKLTIFILAGLVLGVAVGYVYNVSVIGALNNRISAANAAIPTVQDALKGLTAKAGLDYQMLTRQRDLLNYHITYNQALIDKRLEPFTLPGDIFLRLIKMIIAPLVFTSLVAGVAKMGNIKSVGRVGAKTLLWFLGASLVSLLLGMLMVNVLQPGKAMHLDNAYSNLVPVVKANTTPVTDFITRLVPKNFFEAMENNEILQIVLFSLLFGAAAGALGEKGRTLVKVFEVIMQVLIKITGYIMLLAPLAVFGAMVAVVARQGIGIVSAYAFFMGGFYFSLAGLWALIIFAGYLVLNRRVFALVAGIKDAMLTAFGTSTSEAAYPALFTRLEQFGCSNKIVSFVLPLGYSFNLDGGMMYMTFASLFIAQAYHIHLSLVQQVSMLLLLMFASKGVAGVPRAALVIVAATLTQFNIPAAGLAVIIGIDPLLDMGRSATNVLGNAVATAVVSKWEGEVNEIQ